MRVEVLSDHVHQQLQQTEQQLQNAPWPDEQILSRRGQQLAGSWAEDAVAWGLSALSDDWVLLRGYRNRRGETDLVLVGPPGVWAIEVKCMRIRLYVTGDEWEYEKVDRRGKVRGNGWGVDHSGRSWAHEVNDVADDLARWLARNGQPDPVRRAVMIAHDGAQVVHREQLTVDLVDTHPTPLLNAICSYPPFLSREDCATIAGLVRRDHAYHARRRGGG